MLSNHWQAEIFRMKKEGHFVVSAIILLALVGLAAWFNKDASGSELALGILGLVSTFLPLFFLAPAKVFFGEEFAARTINNQLVRSQHRLTIFAIRSFFMTIFSLGYLVLIYLATGLAVLVLGGQLELGLLGQNLVNQLPFSLCLIGLLIFLSNYLEKIYQVNTVYIILCLMIDQLLGLTLGNVLDASLYQPFLAFSQLSQVLGNPSPAVAPVLIALLGTGLYLAVSAAIFNKREFK